MKSIALAIPFLAFSFLGNSQENLGVNQSNPQAKTHITNAENQNSFRVDDEAGDATPFVIDSLGNTGVKTNTPSVSLDINATDAIGMPNGTTAQRPALASAGDMRFNSDLNLMEYYDGTRWNSISLVPVGSMQPFGGTTGLVPSGWLLCDGTAISRTTYADLFAIIGTNYGAGDGATTFNLPDLRGRFLRGTDNGTGNDPDASSRVASNLGGNTGDAVGSYQDEETRMQGSFANINPGSQASYSILINNGGTTGSETRPKNVNVNYIIKF